MLAEGLSYGLLVIFTSFFLAWPLLKKTIQSFLVFLYVPWRNTKGERMRGEPPNLPYGHLAQVNFFGRALSHKHGPIYYIWHCLTPVVVLCDAEAIRSFYTDHYSHKRERNLTCLGTVFREVFGECMATSHGRKEVKRCRGPFETFFSASAATSALPVIGRECKTFLQSLPIGKPVDLMKDGLADVTLRTLIHVVYGDEVLQKYFDKIVDIKKQLEDTIDLFNIGETFLPFYSSLPTKVNTRSHSFNKRWVDFNRSLFAEYQEGRLDPGNGLFFDLMECVKRNTLELREEELFQSVDEILLLNIDVSYAATSFALGDIAKYPAVQEKLRREIDHVLQGQDPSSFSDLDKRLPYLEIVLKESSRMHPALALSLPERTVKPVTDMGGYQIPQGTPICVDTHSLNFSEKYWKNPDEFNPERFDKEARQVLCSFFRFGMGPRKCLGFRYALAITRVVVVSALQAYKLELADPDGPARVKTKGMPFFTPYLCPEIVFHER